MELADYLAVFRRFWRSTAAIAAAALIAAIGALALLPKAYSAQLEVFVTVMSGNSGSDLASGSSYSQNQVDSFARVAVSPLVLDPVIQDLRLADMSADDLARYVTVNAPAGTAIMVITAQAADPETSALIANAVGENLVRVVEQLSPLSTEDKPLVRATIISKAEPPKTHSSPSGRNTLLIGLLIGLVLGFGQAFLRFILDTRIHGDEEVEQLTNTPIMGRIGQDTDIAESSATRASVSKLTAEDYRRLRTNLQFLAIDASEGNPNRAKTIVITSSVPSEGKSTISLHLAQVLAEAGEQVLLIDGDLRRPRIAKYLGLENNAGLTTALIGKASPSDVLQQTPIKNLSVMASGAIPPNPSELLGSPAMKKLLDSAGMFFSYIIIDSAPLLPVTDGAILTQQTNGCLLIIDTQRTTRSQLEASIESIATANGTILGVVLNKLQREKKGYGSKYGYYHDYGEEYIDTFDALQAPPRSRGRAHKRQKAAK